MLFKFNPELVSFKRVLIKHVTTALGGSVSIVDEEETKRVGKEQYTKINMPMALARMFKVKYQITKYIKPIEGCLMFYGDKLIGIERALMADQQREVEGLFGKREWITNMETNFRDYIKEWVADGRNWYFDGTFLYAFEDNDLQKVVDKAEFLNAKGSFRMTRVESVHVSYIGFTSPQFETRTCVIFRAGDGKFEISAPIWKQMGGVGNTNNDDQNIDNEDLGLNGFDEIDRIMAVNLNFALAAGKDVAEHFGYDAIEPLQFPEMMLAQKTVNLPKVPKEIKATFDIGMSFQDVMAWLMGLQHRSDNMDQFMAVRRLMKYATTKALFRKSVMQRSNIFKNLEHEEAVVDIPRLTIEEAEQSGTTMYGNWDEYHPERLKKFNENRNARDESAVDLTDD